MYFYNPSQFDRLSAPIELIPAVGADTAIALVQHAMQLGGLDFVLIHPQFLSDRSQVARETGLIESWSHGLMSHGLGTYGNITVILRPHLVLFH